MPWLLAFTILLSGCTTAPVEPEEEVERKDWGIRVNGPILVNRTIEEGFFWYEARMYDECYGNTNFFPYVLFDKHGKRYERVVIPPDNGTQRIRIDLEGEPPYLLAGAYPWCAEWFDLAVFGIAEGAALGYWNGFNMREAVQEDFHKLVVPPGGSNASLTVPIPEWGFELSQVGPWDLGWPRTYGTVTMRALEHDFIMRQDHFRLLGIDETTIWNGYPYMPGGHIIELELDQPAVLASTWEYYVEYFVFRPETGICAFGFEWEICK